MLPRRTFAALAVTSPTGQGVLRLWEPGPDRARSRMSRPNGLPLLPPTGTPQGAVGCHDRKPVPAMGSIHPHAVVVEVVVVGMVAVPRPAAFWRGEPGCAVTTGPHAVYPRTSSGAKTTSVRLWPFPLSGISVRASGRTRQTLAPTAEQPPNLVGKAGGVFVLTEAEQLQSLALAE